MNADPHRDQPVLHSGHDLAGASGAVVLLHGRGASAEDILGLAEEFDQRSLAYRAPQAAGHTWYPYSFLAPIAQNEPGLTSALNKVSAIVNDLVRGGVPLEKIVVAGFSQGACLASEFIARNAARYGGLIALTGGLIGPPGTKFQFPGNLAGTPAFLGAGDPDPHVPWERVEETANVLSSLGAEVTLRRYAGMPHTVSRQEIDEAKRILSHLRIEARS